MAPSAHRLCRQHTNHAVRERATGALRAGCVPGVAPREAPARQTCAQSLNQPPRKLPWWLPAPSPCAVRRRRMRCQLPGGSPRAKKTCGGSTRGGDAAMRRGGRRQRPHRKTKREGRGRCKARRRGAAHLNGAAGPTAARVAARRVDVRWHGRGGSAVQGGASSRPPRAWSGLRAADPHVLANALLTSSACRVSELTRSR